MVLYYRVKIMYFNKIMKSYQFIFLKIPWKFFSNSLVIYSITNQIKIPEQGWGFYPNKVHTELLKQPT